MPVQITKVVAGSGDELPAPPAMLAPNGGITIPLMRPLNLKVQAYRAPHAQRQGGARHPAEC